MARKLAFMTYGHLVAAFGQPEVQSFVDRVPSVYDSADGMPGFIARSKRNMADYTHSWGEIVTPRCWGGVTRDNTAATLSLWEDIESVAAFAYHGAHGEAMTKRKEWFIHNGLPEHVGWWLEEGADPDWQDASDRMDHLHDNGSTAYAFNLRSPFDAAGQPYRLDTALVRAKASSQTPASKG